MKRKILLLCLAVFVLFSGYVFIETRPVEVEVKTALSFVPLEEARNALYYASLAPSTYNSQPWKVVYDAIAKIYSLSVDPARRLMHNDPANREAYLALGAFLENLALAAPALGLYANIEYTNLVKSDINDDSVAKFFIDVNNRPLFETAASAKNLELIRKRHSDSRYFSQNKIAPQVLEELNKRHGGYAHYYAKGTPEFDYFATNTIQSMRLWQANLRKRDELNEWLRFSDIETKEKRDGLPAELLGFTGVDKFLYYLKYNHEKSMSFEFYEDLIKRAEKNIENTAGFFVITGGDSTEELVQTGREYQKFWLDATAYGVSMEPMNQIITESNDLNKIMQNFSLREKPQMILRAGVVSDYGKNLRINRTLADFVEEGKQ